MTKFTIWSKDGDEQLDFLMEYPNSLLKLILPFRKPFHPPKQLLEMAVVGADSELG